MEDLLGSFEGSLNVSLNNFSSVRQHPRLSQFKLKSNKNSQEERRKLTLEAQKQKRYDFQNHIRRLAENDFESMEDEANDSENGIEAMDWVPPKVKVPRTYKDQIMLSEWLIDVPSDLEENWIMVLSPIGKRCLLVASKGQTKVYTKSGFKISEFSSLLPGGSPSKSCDSTILDCLWNEQKQTYYVLDVLSWGKVPLLGCEAQFRFYWLQSKFSEQPQLSEKSKSNNKYPLVRVPFTLCTKENMESIMIESSLSFSTSLDGLLFYHKLGFYTPQVSPLVGWLKPFMLPEILNICVPEVYLQKRPLRYENIRQYLDIKHKPKVSES